MHGVPDSEQRDGDRHERVQRWLGRCLLRAVAVDLRKELSERRVAARPDVHAKERRQVVGVGLGWQAAGPGDEARDGLGSCCAAAEAEDEDLVTRQVVERDEAQGVLDVSLEAGAAAAAEELVAESQQHVRQAWIRGERADADVVVDDLVALVCWASRQDRSREFEHV